MKKGQAGVHLKVFMENNMYVANTGDKDVNIPAGTLLCGYGRGKLGRNVNGSFNPDWHHMFNIKTCDDF
eukprot:341024-Lingulodinium_polyedra.AAC.1